MPSPSPSLTRATVLMTILVGAALVAQEAVAQSRYIFVAGRRLPYLYAISFDALRQGPL
jgi:hypothetical protein